MNRTVTLPEILGASKAVNNEEAYRLDAARTMVTAAATMLRTAERIATYAQQLANGTHGNYGAFPAARQVREAMNEYRNNPAQALMYLDSALESAMLADAERISPTV